jgi:hypothetical protein
LANLLPISGEPEIGGARNDKFKAFPKFESYRTLENASIFGLKAKEQLIGFMESVV